MKLLICGLLLVSGCGKKGSDVVGSWSGQCKKEEGLGNNPADVDCSIEISKANGNVYPVHASGMSGEIECELEGTFDDDGKVFRVLAPKSCGGLGSKMTSLAMFIEDGKLDFLGNFAGGRYTETVRLKGLLARGEKPAAAKGGGGAGPSAPSASAPAPSAPAPSAPAPSAPPPAAPPRP
jgi:hypothetical protein